MGMKHWFHILCECDCWRGSGVCSSILCVSVTSWCECFCLEIRWSAFAVDLSSSRSRAASVWSFTFISENTKKAQLWGQLGSFTCSLISNLLHKAGKAELGGLTKSSTFPHGGAAEMRSHLASSRWLQSLTAHLWQHLIQISTCISIWFLVFVLFFLSDGSKPMTKMQILHYS